MAHLRINDKNGNSIPVTVVYNQNGGGTIQFWKGTVAEYQALTSAQLSDLNNDNTVFFIQET